VDHLEVSDSFVPVPEPSSLLLSASVLALMGVTAGRRRRNRRQSAERARWSAGTPTDIAPPAGASRAGPPAGHHTVGVLWLENRSNVIGTSVLTARKNHLAWWRDAARASSRR